MKTKTEDRKHGMTIKQEHFTKQILKTWDDIEENN